MCRKPHASFCPRILEWLAVQPLNTDHLNVRTDLPFSNSVNLVKSAHQSSLSFIRKWVAVKLKYMLNALHRTYCIDSFKYLLYWHSCSDSLPSITLQ